MDDMFQLSDTVDDLKRKLDFERNRSAVLEASLREPNYQLWRGICYKAFNTREPFNEAAAACRKDGGTLAMPRDAETNAFLSSLYTTVGGRYFFIDLQDQREEGRFEWADGSALGMYKSWAPGEPDGRGDCVVSGASGFWGKGKWFNYECDWSFLFACQVMPGI
ncbi:collectin-10-like [Branchiostoma floridae]|uniref:Collectin-10-like n=1 Tax=Branchiostoma floridae TaxID=7739 RepID=A0A9J7LUF4_BRAFL|nr:collectin-10-like [Branchiostoma floridae]